MIYFLAGVLPLAATSLAPLPMAHAQGWVNVVFPEREEAEWRVLRIQKKLHRWATEDPGRRFDDLASLVCDPAFLAVAWHRVRGSKGARTAGVDGVTPRGVGWAAADLLAGIREDLMRRDFTDQAYDGAGRRIAELRRSWIEP